MVSTICTSGVPAGFTPSGPAIGAKGLSLPTRLLVIALFQFGVTWARPLLAEGENGGELPATKDPKTYAYLGIAIALVLLGGAFAGLTIALMGQDEIYLQVIATSGDGAERRNATKVLRLLKRGKHWVLVTLLVGNVITNETLPLVLDRSLGGGLAAAVSSTVLVIVFGEIVPQSVCVRYGLPIGAWMSPFVLLLMWLFAPITWPIAKLLDRILGEDHGTVYKKAGLKTLVTLHQTIGTTPNERLNEDEVSIIKGVLDLKAKSVGSIMTPMNDVFTLSADATLDEDMMNIIMREGYSRIPIHEPSNKGDFVGMLLVKMLITYDPEDARKVSEFSLATLPETRPETSCLDIINFFQEGKSHMVLVSDFPGEPYGALGVVTLEDVIEELIGEEIIDESDVFIDVHKAIRRIHPAPTHHAKVSKSETVVDGGPNSVIEGEPVVTEGNATKEEQRKSPVVDTNHRVSVASTDLGHSPRPTTFLLRQRKSLGSHDFQRVRGYTPEIKEQLKNLGPSNAAKQPKPSRVNTVKIKNATGKPVEDSSGSGAPEAADDRKKVISWPNQTQGGIGQDLVGPGKTAKDGVQAVQAGYGTWDKNAPKSVEDALAATESFDSAEHSTFSSSLPQRRERLIIERSQIENDMAGPPIASDGTKKIPLGASMSEQLVDSGGVKKLVLEMTSSSDDADENSGPIDKDEGDSSSPLNIRNVNMGQADEALGKSDSTRVRSKRRRRKPQIREDHIDGEQTPLIHP